MWFSQVGPLQTHSLHPPCVLTVLHSRSRVDLVKVDRGVGLSLNQRIVLEGAHGDDIIRSIYVDEGVSQPPDLLS